MKSKRKKPAFDARRKSRVLSDAIIAIVHGNELDINEIDIIEPILQRARDEIVAHGDAMMCGSCREYLPLEAFSNPGLYGSESCVCEGCAEMNEILESDDPHGRGWAP